MSKSKALILGLAGTEINADEYGFFQEHSPLGFILFARNIENPQQVKKLVADLRECVGRHCPILIDQEGGRVARLKPPHWKKHPSMHGFAEMALKDLKMAGKQVYENFQSIGEELISLGIDVDCAPVVDLLFDHTHDVIGDRSFGSAPEIVAYLAGKCAEALQSRGVKPIIKHIPGHGRAKSDSHKELPVVDTSYEELMRTDFAAFKLLSSQLKIKAGQEFAHEAPWAMTAHILYSAIDAKNPATQSSKVIDIIRNEIGFKGILISDDLSMEALQGDYAERTERSFAAGCDLVLHCNGKMEEMIPVAENTPVISSSVKYAAARC